MVRSPAPTALRSHSLEGLPGFEFSHTMSLAIGGIQPKVWAAAGRATRLQIATRTRHINGRSEGFLVLAAGGKLGTWLTTNPPSPKPSGAHGGVCGKIFMNSSETRHLAIKKSICTTNFGS